MVTTRSQERKIEESELPVRPRSEDVLSSPTLKRPGTLIDEAPPTKRSRTYPRTPIGIGQTLQNLDPSNAAADDDGLAATHSNEAVAAIDPSHLASEFSHAADDPSPATAEPINLTVEEIKSDQQPVEPLPQGPDEAASPVNGRSDSLASETSVKDETTPKTGSFQVHKRFGSEDAESEIFVTPETSRKKQVAETSDIQSNPVSAPLSSNPTNLPGQPDVHAAPLAASTLLAPRPPPPSMRILRRYSKSKLSTFASPIKPSSSISRFRQTMLERHKRTPFWAGRKARFVDVSAR